MNDVDRRDFEQAMGEEFAESLVPPLAFEDASVHECCEVVWQVLGDRVDPDMLAAVSDEEVAQLAEAFGGYFETAAPSTDQIRQAIARTLGRWPAGTKG